MLKVISWVIIGFVYNISYCYFFSRLTSTKFKYNKNVVLFSILFSLINCYSVYYIPHIRVAVINLCAIILLSIVYKQSILTCCFGQLCIAIINGISEIIFVIIFCQIFKIDSIIFSQNPLMMLLSNIIIILLSKLFVEVLKIKKFKLFYNNKKINSEVNTLILFILSFVVISILLYPLSNGKLNTYTFIMYAVTFLSGIVFISAFLLEKNKENKIMNEYDSLSKYVKVYEKLIDEKSKQQHENKNQLVIVRSMIHKNNKKALDYIDKLLNIDLSKQDDDYINKLKNIPDGIKGLIYYKIEEMKNLGICVYLDVPNKINKNTKILCEENLTDLSIILGVYLDNAKEAAASSDKKYVIIELKEEENIIFTISNTYKDTINFERIDKPKFTSKGKGHGYGLSLVKDIIEKNESFEQRREINGIYYVQSLILKQKDDISK